MPITGSYASSLSSCPPGSPRREWAPRAEEEQEVTTPETLSAGPWTHMPPPDPSLDTALLLQAGMQSPSRQKEVRGRGAWHGLKGGQGMRVPMWSNTTRSNDVHPNCFSLRDAQSFLFTCYAGNRTINNLSPIGWRASDPSVKLILTGQVSGQKARNAVLGNSQHHN